LCGTLDGGKRKAILRREGDRNMAVLRVLSWNVNGFRSVYRKGFLDWLQQEQPDILCLQETKADPEQLPPEVREVSGYRAHFSPAQRKGYSGVAVYTKPKPDHQERRLGQESFDREGRLLRLDYPGFTLLNVYFPNGKASRERLLFKLAFYDHFLEYTQDLREQGRSLVICGDVNTAHKPIDLARPRQNEKTSGFLPEEREWIDRFLDQGYVDSFRLFHPEPDQYTWWDLKTRARERNVGWRIDYFFVSRDLEPRVKAAYILPQVQGSDHCPIGLDLEDPAQQ
jgi:exodeoxyribonuclease-3